jgi:hypothetical protein
MNKYQQGDVLFIELTDKEAKSFQDKKESKTHWNKINVTRESNGDTVVAYGEATGHNHNFQFHEDMVHYPVTGYVTDMGRRGITNALNYVEVEKTATLTHQEHNEIQVPPGKYKVQIVREFDHIGRVTRNVVD